MNWKNKARIMKLFSHLPYGEHLYKIVQRNFGRLSADPMTRVPYIKKVASMLNQHGFSIEDKIVFEVGTGHKPIMPICFFLAGAKSVITVDLHPRIDWELTAQAIQIMLKRQDELIEFLDPTLSKQTLNERFSFMAEYQQNPKEFFEQANIKYLAPLDAGNTNLSENSVDLHFSCTVLEHIPLNSLRDIFTEGKRIIKPSGAFIHFVDLSDHFQHQDNSITTVNFLQFSEQEWKQIAGNQFAYCNRLRRDDFIDLFQELQFNIIEEQSEIDQEGLDAITNGILNLHPDYRQTPVEKLAVISLNILMRNQNLY